MRGKQTTGKRRGVVRGRLFRNPLRPSDRLVYVRDFLDWVYAKGKSPPELQHAALAWWVGLTPEQFRQWGPRDWPDLIKPLPGWDWVPIQDEARRRVERLFLPRQEPLHLEPVTAPRVLGIFKDKDGESYWYYDTQTLLPHTGEEWVSRAIDRTLYDLRDMNLKVIGHCAECGRVFVRLRPTVSRYCSPGCRHLAWLKAHGFKPPEKTKAKRGSKEPVKTA